MSKHKPEKPDLYLCVVETRDNGYFHLTARVVTQKYEQSVGYVPYGCDDDYSDGPKYTGLRVSCQGDQDSQRKTEGAVYGYDCVYRDVYSLDLRQARRTYKTLETIDRKLEKLREARGYVRTYGEYLGRIAEILGCKGIAFERTLRAREISGAQWDWLTIGDGVNRATAHIYAWHQEAIQRETVPAE